MCIIKSGMSRFSQGVLACSLANFYLIFEQQIVFRLWIIYDLFPERKRGEKFAARVHKTTKSLSLAKIIYYGSVNRPYLVVILVNSYTNRYFSLSFATFLGYRSIFPNRRQLIQLSDYCFTLFQVSSDYFNPREEFLRESVC